jgi:phosphatidylinositol-3-phosphatase
MRWTHRRLGTVAASAALAALVPLVLIGTAGAEPVAPQHQPGAPARHVPRLDHIFVIMLENHSRSSVIDDPNAPFITGLAHGFGMADNYFGVTHPSMPNYLAAIAGDNFGIQDDDDQNVVNLDRPNLVDQLEAHGRKWGAYMETLPADKTARFGPTLADGTVVQLYAKKHNPFVLFDSVASDPDRMAQVKDYSELAADLDSPNPPDFVWISPNQCNDMHGGVNVAVPGHPETPCPFGRAKDDANDAALKHKADEFVRGAVETITSSRAWRGNSAIFVVTDENDFTGNEQTGGWETADGCCDSPYVPKGDPRVSADWPGGTYGGGLIPAVVVTTHGPRGVVSHTPYNHYSLLATIEDSWGLGHLGHAGDRAGGVVPMADLLVGR